MDKVKVWSVLFLVLGLGAIGLTEAVEVTSKNASQLSLRVLPPNSTCDEVNIDLEACIDMADDILHGMNQKATLEAVLQVYGIFDKHLFLPPSYCCQMFDMIDCYNFFDQFYPNCTKPKSKEIVANLTGWLDGSKLFEDRKQPLCSESVYTPADCYIIKQDCDDHNEAMDYYIQFTILVIIISSWGLLLLVIIRLKSKANNRLVNVDSP